MEDAAVASQDAIIESGGTPSNFSTDAGKESEGTLASDTALQALRDKLNTDDEE